MTGYEIAKTKINLTEKDSFLAKFLHKYGFQINPEKTAWCAAFINACEREAGNRGTNSLAAQSFLKYGDPVKEEDIQPGDIVIFSRGVHSWQGHVGYFESWSDDYVSGSAGLRVLGGNQDNKVCSKVYGKERLLGIRRSV